MEQFVEINGAKIWTSSTGKGIPFILCNGGPGCDDYLEPVSKLLEDHCRVVRWEPRGCGRSDYDGNYDLSTTIEDIESLRKVFEFDQIIIGGHSAGPDLALAYTLKYPENVLGLIGIAGGRIVNDREWSATYKKNKAERGEDEGGKIWQADPPVNRIGNQTWRTYIKRPHLLKDIAKIKVPALFINAQNDIRPNWPTQQLASLIPNGEYIEIAGAAHMIWLTHATELKKALEYAVDKIRAASF